MKEKEIVSLLKGQEKSLKALEEQTECYTADEKVELKNTIEKLMDGGIVAEINGTYYLLKDRGEFLAEITVKTRNYVILKAIPSGEECRISGEEADQLLVGTLVYAKEFQRGIYHCLDYYRPVLSLKGYYSFDNEGNEIVSIDYLNRCEKKVVVTSIAGGLEDKIGQGDLVEAKIIDLYKDTIEVEITDLLVSAQDVGSDISMIIAENGAAIDFPKSVLDEVKDIPTEVTKEDLEGREDYRDVCVVTIDGDDAHDFDDAVSIKKDGSGYELTVYIADVTHYVKTGHPLDDEAKARGTSIYVADRVVPMLPFELSNGICSLNPNADRLVLAVTMGIDSMGNAFNPRVHRGVIKSHGRLTYNKVNEYFEGKDVEYSDEIKDALDLLHDASLKIRRRRRLQGSIELDSTELKFKLDENGTPIEVKKMKQGESEKMIEDLMIVANCSIARLLASHGIPVLYRVHELPPKDKLSTFRDYLKKMRLLKSFPKSENLSGAKLNDFLASVEDDNIRSSVSHMMLRAMAKARYSPEDIGHFGLAELDYCHFTSPIRRYPDDIIHRLVKDYIIDKKPVDYDEEYARLEYMGDVLSREEIRADHIQRECDDLESAKYMEQHIGELYHGRVTGLVQRGMFIETDIGIEGFLAYHCMHGDFFNYDERNFAAFGKETDISFSIGTEIDVKVLASNPMKREIDFATPEFYDEYAIDLDETRREKLSLDGIRIYQNGSRPMMTGRMRFRYDEEDNGMNNITEEDNIAMALDNMDATEAKIQKIRKEREEDDGFRPTKEQWKDVDIIRAVVAKYPDDEQKAIMVLEAMDITEEEYRKLLRFTKPREREGGRSFSGRGGRSSSRGGFSHDRKSSFGGRRSYGDSDRKSSYGDRKSSYGDKKPAKKRNGGNHSGYAAGLEKKYRSDSEQGKRGFHSHDRDNGYSSDRRGSYSKKGYGKDTDKANYASKRTGYGKKRKEY